MHTAYSQTQPHSLAYLGSLRFLKVANDWKVNARKESIVNDCVILPAVASATHIIIGFLDELGALVEIESGTNNVVKLKAILFKDTTDALGLNPKECRKNDVKASSKDSNKRGTSISSIS